MVQLLKGFLQCLYSQIEHQNTCQNKACLSFNLYLRGRERDSCNKEIGVLSYFKALQLPAPDKQKSLSENSVQMSSRKRT